jgi:hypothetical protein
MKAPTSDRNSPMKPENPGRPMPANIVATKRPVSTGAGFQIPPMSPISRVCSRSYSMPTSRNSAPVVSGWLTIVKTAPSMPMTVSEKMPRITKPMCATDEYAMTRFKSVCIAATIAP